MTLLLSAILFVLPSLSHAPWPGIGGGYPDRDFYPVVGGGYPSVFNRHCYSYEFTPLTWVEARAECNRQGLRLISIESVQEHRFILEQFALGEERFWVGALYWNGQWIWLDGRLVLFEDGWWSRGEPDGEGSQTCAQTNYRPQWGGEALMDDAGCDVRKPFLCKVPYCR